MNLSRLRLANGTSALRYEPARAPHRLQVLLTHGLTASAASLDLLSAYLAGHGYRTLALDLPGHKLGCTGGQLDSVSQAVGVIEQAIATLGPPVVLAGHSFGAASSTLAARHPAVVGLCVVAVGAFGRRRFTSALGTSMRDVRSTYVDGIAIDDLLAQMHEALAPPLDHLQDKAVLVVGADQDALVPAAEIQRWQERVPHARTEWVNASHMDAPVVARAIIGRWLDELETSSIMGS